jgi:hypothetical protein
MSEELENRMAEVEKQIVKLECAVQNLDTLTLAHRDESRKSFSAINARMDDLHLGLHQLIVLRERALGALWVISILFGTTAFGSIVALWDYFVQKGGH